MAGPLGSEENDGKQQIINTVMEKIDNLDLWMFGEPKVIRRLRKMFIGL